MKPPQLVLSTWLVADSEGEESVFPQNRGVSSQWSFQETYWRCILVYFFTARLYHPKSKRVLFVNKAPRKEAASCIRHLDEIGVEIIKVDFETRPPSGFTDRFGNQFYIFDLLAYIARRPSPEVWYILDSDCVFTKSHDLVSPVLNCVQQTLTYDARLGERENINGLSRIELTQIAQEEGWRRNEELVSYCGGEFFAASVKAVAAHVATYSEIRRRNVERWAEGKKAVTEEAHVLSLAYEALGVRIGTANEMIKRMWTTFRYRNIEEIDEQLPIWHLPSEKRTGIYDLSRDIEKRWSASRSSDWWRRRIAKRCGVPKRNLLKWANDLGRKMAEKYLR